MISRRTFINGVAVGAAGAAFRSTAKSYAQIVGSNERLNFAIFGLNGRGYAHLSGLKNNSKSARVSYVCDVDQKILDKFSAEAQKELGYAPATATDFRKVLASKDVDVITIATPDHWQRLWPSTASRPANRQRGRDRRLHCRRVASFSRMPASQCS